MGTAYQTLIYVGTDPAVGSGVSPVDSGPALGYSVVFQPDVPIGVETVFPRGITPKMSTDPLRDFQKQTSTGSPAGSARVASPMTAEYNEDDFDDDFDDDFEDEFEDDYEFEHELIEGEEIEDDDEFDEELDDDLDDDELDGDDDD